MESNLFWCIIGIIGGAIFSLLISLFFYLKGSNRKRLVYDIQTSRIIWNGKKIIKKLEIKYNSTEIENLYISRITIKNIGNSIIEKHDFANPISIFTHGQFIKDSSNMEITNMNSLYKYFISFCNDSICDYVELNTIYIPKNDIITFTLFHTDSIHFSGALKDGKIVSMKEKKLFKKTYHKVFSILSKILFIVIGIVFTLLYSLFFKH